jgi:hypothetical protein
MVRRSSTAGGQSVTTEATIVPGIGRVPAIIARNLSSLSLSIGHLIA